MIPILLVLFCTLSFCIIIAKTINPERPYFNPSPTLGETDLIGVWEAHYHGNAVDRLIIKPDGTFRQIYQAREVPGYEGYEYQTPWNRWWLEKFPDGRVRLYLEGAKYFFDGVRTAENPIIVIIDGNPIFRVFCDPIASENRSVQMQDALILNVRSDQHGNIILLHMRFSGDSCVFALLTKYSRDFHKIEDH